MRNHIRLFLQTLFIDKRFVRVVHWSPYILGSNTIVMACAGRELIYDGKVWGGVFILALSVFTFLCSLRLMHSVAWIAGYEKGLKTGGELSVQAFDEVMAKIRAEREKDSMGIPIKPVNE